MNNISAASIIAAATFGSMALPLWSADPKPASPSKAPTAASNERLTSTATAPRNSGFVAADERMYLVQNGNSIPVTVQYMLRVSPAGIIGFDGRKLSLPAGHMLDAKGQIVPMPENIKGLPAPAKAPPPPSPQENLSEDPAD